MDGIAALYNFRCYYPRQRQQPFVFVVWRGVYCYIDADKRIVKQGVEMAQQRGFAAFVPAYKHNRVAPSRVAKLLMQPRQRRPATRERSKRWIIGVRVVRISGQIVVHRGL